MGRTKKNIQLKIPEKPRKIKGFRSGSCRIATTISSAAPSTTRTTLQGLSQHQNYLGKRGELMGRTSKNIKLKIPEKPRKIKGFRNGGYRIATTISSQSRYDHFDTAPYLSQHQHLGKRGELMGRTSKNIKLRIPEKPHKIKGFRTGSYRVATTISSAARSTTLTSLQDSSQHRHVDKRGGLMVRTMISS